MRDSVETQTDQYRVNYTTTRDKVCEIPTKISTLCHFCMANQGHTHLNPPLLTKTLPTVFGCD